MGDKLERRIQREGLIRAATSTFFSIESAIIIALVIVLTAFNIQPFDWWQTWFWILGGLIAEVVLIGVSLTDSKHWMKVAQEHLERQFDPDRISNERSRERLKKALVYRAQMEELLHAQGGALGTNLRLAAEEMEKGIEVMYNLGRRLDTLRANDLIRQDFQTVPQAIKQMEQRLETETDPTVQAELEAALRTKQAQHENLRKIESAMKRADIQIDNMLASIGAAYTQMQLIDAKDIDSSRARRLRDDVAEQVQKTQDVIYAMEEVYQQQSSM
jgi:hypothetical protein